MIEPPAVSRRMRQAMMMAALSVAISGCALRFSAETLGIRATVSEPAANQVVGDDFTVSNKAVFVLWGIVPVTKPSLERALSGQLIDGTEVANLDVHVRSRFGDIVVMVLTGGLVVPRTVTFSGTVVNRSP